MGVSVRAVLRMKETLCTELRLDDPELPDVALLDTRTDHPALINRPIVVTQDDAALCRPPERVLETLPNRRHSCRGEGDGGAVPRDACPITR